MMLLITSVKLNQILVSQNAGNVGVKQTDNGELFPVDQPACGR